MSTSHSDKTFCPLCFNDAFRNMAFKPPAGFDPGMREYKCQNQGCKQVFYLVPQNNNALQSKKKPVKEQASMILPGQTSSYFIS